VRDARYRTNDRKVFRWLLLGLLAFFGALYVALVLHTSDRIPSGTKVNGIEVGGLRPASAEGKLAEGLGGRAAEPITVAALGQRAVIRPSTAGFTVDVRATVEQAGADPDARNTWDPRRVWEYYAGGEDHEAVVAVDATKLAQAVERFAEQVDDPAVEGSVVFDGGQVSARYPQKGTILDRDGSAAAIRAAFLHGTGPNQIVRLPTRVDTPQLSKQTVSDAMDDFANPAMSGPVVVKLAGSGVVLEPEDYSDALSMQRDGDSLRPKLDDKALVRLLRPRMKKIDRGPRSARFVVRGDRVRVVPSRNGVTFRDADVTRTFLSVLTRTGTDRVMTVRSRPARPGFSTADARRLKITEPVSSFSTRFPFAAYRNINIPRAAHLIDGTVLEPGETFSLNRVVGERTPANGFTEGYVIADGVYAKELGGGVSQVATTTFNAAFFAGLQDVTHTAHSFYIDRYPVGREATVVWPHTDLRFKNTTPYGVLVHASVTKATPSQKGTMRVTMFSTKYWDIRTTKSGRYNQRPPHTRHLSGSGCVPNQGYSGFDIDVDRLFYRQGSKKLDHRETMHTSYKPSDSVICKR
jgi:vancomycin resistance protein YoaR